MSWYLPTAHITYSTRTIHIYQRHTHIYQRHTRYLCPIPCPFRHGPLFLFFRSFSPLIKVTVTPPRLEDEVEDHIYMVCLSRLLAMFFLLATSSLSSSLTTLNSPLFYYCVGLLDFASSGSGLSPSCIYSTCKIAAPAHQ
jgi:hypothetical protein